jgi:hypothetical protein
MKSGEIIRNFDALNRRDPIVLELSLCYSGGIQLIAGKKSANFLLLQ